MTASKSLFVVSRKGQEKRIDVAAAEDRPLMEIIRDANIDDEFGMCGGNCSCATCHIYVEESAVEFFPTQSQLEDELLDGSAARKPNSRLSCQLQSSKVRDGLKVTIAPSS